MSACTKGKKEDSNSSHSSQKIKDINDTSCSSPGPGSTTTKMHDAGTMKTTTTTTNRNQRIVLHILTILVYCIPMLQRSHSFHQQHIYTNIDESNEILPGGPVLDEIHILSNDNHDINGGESSASDYWTDVLRPILTNDYWGRPMNAESSHKSWRPLTVLSFRYLQPPKQQHSTARLLVHRLVNILTHSTACELVGTVATQLFCGSTTSSTLFWNVHFFTKLFFAIHPSHVEVTINAANRNHIVSVLFAIYACNCCCTNPSIVQFVGICILGLLSSETFLFQLVSIFITILCITILQQQRHDTNHKESTTTTSSVRAISTLVQKTLRQTWIRLLCLIVLAVTYYGARWYYDTLSIPDGLIRPAENPFFTLTGLSRLYSYSYILALHVMKAWMLDVIGPSHEYGYDCIATISSLTDKRMFLPIGLVLLHILIGAALLIRQYTVYTEYNNYSQHQQLNMGKNSTNSSSRTFIIVPALIYYLVYLAWLLTLFPVSGMVKVGTFVSDRITVPATVPVCMMLGYGFACWIDVYDSNTTNDDEDDDKDVGLTSPDGGDSLTNTTTTITETHQILYDQCQVGRRRRRYAAFGIVLTVMYTCRTYGRIQDWMDSYTLLQSGLRTCPRYAKAHLEISKIHSGLYPKDSYYNITKAIHHIDTARRIDPNFCDVHFQYAHVAIQQHRYHEYEAALYHALLCPYTMGVAMPRWQQYWNTVLSSQQQQPSVVVASQKRYAEYQEKITIAIQKEENRKKV